MIVGFVGFENQPLDHDKTQFFPCTPWCSYPTVLTLLILSVCVSITECTLVIPWHDVHHIALCMHCDQNLRTFSPLQILTRWNSMHKAMGFYLWYFNFSYIVDSCFIFYYHIARVFIANHSITFQLVNAMQKKSFVINFSNFI